MWQRSAGLKIGFSVLLTIFNFFFLTLMAPAAIAACGGAAPQLSGLLWPVEGKVVNTWSLDCITDRGHRGIDISAPSRSAVKAAAPGRVSFLGYTPAEGGGLTLTIDHSGGLRTTYLHLASVSVRQDESVDAGELIGLAAGPVLHFGVKLHDRNLPGGRDLYFDPRTLLPPEPTGSQSSTDPATDPQASPVAASAEPAATSGGEEPSPAPVPASVEEPAGTPVSVAPPRINLSDVLDERDIASRQAPAAAGLLPGIAARGFPPVSEGGDINVPAGSQNGPAQGLRIQTADLSPSDEVMGDKKTSAAGRQDSRNWLLGVLAMLIVTMVTFSGHRSNRSASFGKTRKLVGQA